MSLTKLESPSDSPATRFLEPHLWRAGALSQDSHCGQQPQRLQHVDWLNILPDPALAALSHPSTIKHMALISCLQRSLMWQPS